MRNTGEPRGAQLPLIRHELPYTLNLQNSGGGLLNVESAIHVMHLCFSVSSPLWIKLKIRLSLMMNEGDSSLTHVSKDTGTERMTYGH